MSLIPLTQPAPECATDSASPDWGDTLKITVHNDVPDNGTSMHWHGVRQLHSNPHDGVNGITECPIAPHTSRVYTFLASQHGSSWYHSHHSAQYGEGVVGTIVFDGPTTANYDVDLGPLTLTDWFYESSWVLDWRAVHVPGPPPGSQNVLVNGTMKSASGTGEYNVIKYVLPLPFPESIWPRVRD